MSTNKKLSQFSILLLFRISNLKQEISELKGGSIVKEEESQKDKTSNFPNNLEKYKMNKKELSENFQMSKIMNILKLKIKTIVSDHEKHFNYLLTLLNFNSLEQLDKNLNLLYRGSENNFSSKTFHNLCDDKGPTLVLVRSSYDKLFGGYASESWHLKGWKSAPKSFVFSLDRQKKHSNNDGNSIYGRLNFGPEFGNDLVLTDECHINLLSHLELGKHYAYSLSEIGSKETQSMLAGSHYFKVVEYEVFGFN